MYNNNTTLSYQYPGHFYHACEKTSENALNIGYMCWFYKMETYSPASYMSESGIYYDV